MADEYTELEYKYRADGIELEDFISMMISLGYDSNVDVSSWDTYYVQENTPDEFLRYRSGAAQEFTIKRKTLHSNNWNRVEVDLPLDPEKIDSRTVTRFCNLLGYYENFKIYKTCFIYKLAPYTYVYYIVYDYNMEEIGRFVEVELDKHSIPTFQSVGVDINSVLNQGELALKELGITPRNRLKKSLFEIFSR